MSGSHRLPATHSSGRRPARRLGRHHRYYPTRSPQHLRMGRPVPLMLIFSGVILGTSLMVLLMVHS